MAEFDIKRTPKEVQELIAASFLRKHTIDEDEMAQRRKEDTLRERHGDLFDEKEFQQFLGSSIISDHMKGVIRRSFDRRTLLSRLDCIRWLIGGSSDLAADVASLSMRRNNLEDFTTNAERFIETVTKNDE